MRTISILLSVLIVAIIMILGIGGSAITAAPLMTQTLTPVVWGPASPTVYCHTAVDALHYWVWDDLEIPPHFMDEENPVRQETDFDVMEYFTVLDHLSMEEGYVLDYHYTNNGLGGAPTLYARPLDDSLEADEEYYRHIMPDGTEASYVQLAVLLTMGEQFYLVWHANYNDFGLLCGEDALTHHIDTYDEFDQPLPDDVQDAARRLDAEVSVKMDNDGVRVTMLGFTKWGGFIQRTFTFIEDRAPVIENEVLVPYDCGVMF